MPAHPKRLLKPSVYLDQSTLSDAYRAGLINDRKSDRLRGYGPLAPWIERVASDADLCVSILHAQELAAWEDVPMAQGLAKWLDGLDVVWMHATEAAQAIEDDHWLAVAVGLCEPSPAPVFAPSLLATMPSMTVSEALASVPLANMASIVTALRVTRDPNVDRSDSLRNARMLRDDRNWAAANLTESEKTRVRGLMWRRELREAALAAHRRLRGSSDDYRRAGHGAEVQDTFVDFVDAHPEAVPMRRVGDAMLYAFAEVAQRRAEGSKKERELASSLYDQAHALLGAAYCDVFTCDALVDRCLGDVRVRLGLPKQLSVASAGGEAAFISELMTRVPV